MITIMLLIIIKRGHQLGLFARLSPMSPRKGCLPLLGPTGDSPLQTKVPLQHHPIPTFTASFSSTRCQPQIQHLRTRVLLFESLFLLQEISHFSEMSAPAAGRFEKSIEIERAAPNESLYADVGTAQGN